MFFNSDIEYNGKLPFKPFPFLKNPHVQTALSSLSYSGTPPPSVPLQIALADGDILSCEVSTPLLWGPADKTVFLIHGLGGSHKSNYMIRMARKIYKAKHRVVRINLRGCGSGAGLSKKPFHSGKSDDILHIIQSFKNQTPNSPFVLIGFSVGGNIALKLAGELKKLAHDLLIKTIAICPPIDLAQSAHLLSLPNLSLYNNSYVKCLKKYGAVWVQDKAISSISDFDNQITAPLWGFQNAADFYKQCSSCFFLSHIDHPCHIVFAADDPIVNYQAATSQNVPACVKIWISSQGGHMGFLGKGYRNFFWLDSLLLSWI